jgi:hypothetical protein
MARAWPIPGIVAYIAGLKLMGARGWRRMKG